MRSSVSFLARFFFILFIFANQSTYAQCEHCWSEKDLQSHFKDGLSPVVLSPVYTGFEYFNHPGIYTSDLGKLGIKTENPPSGFQLNFTLNPEKLYKLTMTGEQISGKTQIRVTRDGAHTWLSAPPSSTKPVVLKNIKDLKVLLYADSLSDFQLRQVTVAECPACKSDDDLKNKILIENPELNSLLKTDPLKAAEVILNWTAQHIVFAFESSPLQNTTGMTASEIYYYIFDKQQGGVYCGGSADFLAKVYHLFNLNAFVVDIGTPQNFLTHVTTVLALGKASHYKYYLFDPTFNITFHDKHTGKFASIDQLFSAMTSKHFNDLIKINNGGLLDRNYIIHAEKLPSSKMNITTQRHAGKYIIFHSHDDFFQNYIKRTHANLLNNNGYLINETLIIQMLQRSLLGMNDIRDQLTQDDFMQFYNKQLGREYKVAGQSNFEKIKLFCVKVARRALNRIHEFI